MNTTSTYNIVRATELYQQAGAYYVRIQAMARQHAITLKEEFDQYDTPDTRYIVITHNEFPVATCRILPLTDSAAEIGRVVVLEDYRGKGLGRLVMQSAEEWIGQLGFSTIVVESRDVAVDFYTRLGYTVVGTPRNTGTFVCLRMEKQLSNTIQ